MIRGVGGSRAEVTRASLDALAAAASALAAFDPQTIVVMSPHAPMVADAFALDDSESFAGSLAQFGDVTPYRWPGDPALAHALASELIGER
jgi:aromatic ring-opening dioxygenase catalytic subunit (LigB family)